MIRFALLAASAATLLAACGNENREALTQLEAQLAETQQRLSETTAELSAQSALAAERRSRAENSLNTIANRANARADIIGRDGEIIGEALVMDSVHGMIVRLQATGLEAGYHGSHLHVVGDCSDAADGFKAAGGHINLTGDEHGLLNPAGYHVGSNFPNFWVGGDVLVTEAFANDLTLVQALDEDGFSLIIHENEDDHVSQPIGGAGGRVACAAFG